MEKINVSNCIEINEIFKVNLKPLDSEGEEIDGYGFSYDKEQIIIPKEILDDEQMNIKSIWLDTSLMTDKKERKYKWLVIDAEDLKNKKIIILTNSQDEVITQSNKETQTDVNVASQRSKIASVAFLATGSYVIYAFVPIASICKELIPLISNYI